MLCNEIEELISDYIEDELDSELSRKVEDHLDECEACCSLRDEMEELFDSVQLLEEEVPFFLKNRLYNIPDNAYIEPKGSSVLLKWVAAMIGTVVLLLNFFYFTNIYPYGHKKVHQGVALIEMYYTMAVDSLSGFRSKEMEPKRFRYVKKEDSEKKNRTMKSDRVKEKGV